ncbi:hypothetical protein JGU66_10200 [Myxococcaceae bacterium JPH2]|nr:hypothetical protein [Myxococcaceae bacterium JPH2]
MNASSQFLLSRRLAVVLPLLLLAACSSLRGKANDLAKKGRFVEAADLYDQLLREAPNDAGLLTARDDLRWRGLSQLLGQARQSRFEERDEEAEMSLEQFLTRRAQWGSKLDGALESSLLDEMESTHRHLRLLISGPAKRGDALTAEAQLGRKQALLAFAEMAPIRRDLEEAVQQGGRATCERLKALPGDAGPHWVGLVSRYCRHYRQAAPEAPVFPEALGVPTWHVSVEGMEDHVVTFLQERLARAFEASPWFSAQAPRQAPLNLEGAFSERAWSQPVELTAAWTESVPYTDHEDRKASVEVPYTVEETYVEKNETKTRKVTKYQTVEYTTTVEVTRYRDEQRSFDYKALQRGVDLRFVLVTEALLRGAHSPLAVKGEDALSASGYEHDVTFTPGGVSPRRANLPVGGAWLEAQLLGYEHIFARKLVEGWRDAWCTSPAVTRDEAARCARAGVALPDPDRAVLADVLGEDAGQVHRLYGTP